MKNSELWALLEELLSIQPLDDGQGQFRQADVGEFMLMSHFDDSSAGFKHRGSQNYVFLVKEPGEGWGLQVPRKDKPFHRGEFPSMQENQCQNTQ